MKKKILILGTVVMLSAPMMIEMTGMYKVDAAEIQNDCETIEADGAIEPRADVIVTKFRVVNGVTQYRRWNETKGYWVDSDWITP